MKKLNISPAVWPALILILLLIYNAFVNPTFFNFVVNDGHVYGSVVDIFLRGAPLILVALGMTLVIAIGGIDLSVGTIAALAAAAAAYSFGLGYNFPTTIAIALLSGVVLGLFNALLIVGMQTQAIVASLVTMVAGRGVAQLLVDGQIVSITNPAYLFIGKGYLAGLPFVITLSVIIVLVLNTLIKKTSASLFIEALGSNALASTFVGLNTKMIKVSVYAFSGLMSAIAGIALSANIRAVDVNNLGVFLELDAILAVVIGGTKLTGGKFSLVGTVLGALVIQTVTTTINTQGIGFETMLMVKASVIIIICLLQSEKVRQFFRRSPVLSAPTLVVATEQRNEN